MTYRKAARFACGLSINRVTESCGKKVASSWSEAFFEFQGEGSREATLKCKCGYYEVAHGKPRTSACHKFTPKGTHEFDRYYCGCHGWD